MRRNDEKDMARPKKYDEEKRTERFNLRLTLAEIEHLGTQAAATGLAPHEYVRRRVLGHVVAPAPRQADAALVSEINRIGVNVNQLARATHRCSDFTAYWREIGGQLEAVLRRVLTHGA